LAAIAVVFDFVKPVLALWRLIDRGSELRRDKAVVGYAGHALLFSKRGGDGESSLRRWSS
jgi:hypothetical protein